MSLEVCTDSNVHMQGHAEEELVGQLRQQLVQDADKLRGSALCDVLWSLGILDNLPVCTFKQLAALLEQQPLRDFQPSVRPLQRPRYPRSCKTQKRIPGGAESAARSMSLLTEVERRLPRL